MGAVRGVPVDECPVWSVVRGFWSRFERDAAATWEGGAPWWVGEGGLCVLWRHDVNGGGHRLEAWFGLPREDRRLGAVDQKGLGGRGSWQRGAGGTSGGDAVFCGLRLCRRAQMERSSGSLRRRQSSGEALVAIPEGWDSSWANFGESGQHGGDSLWVCHPCWMVADLPQRGFGLPHEVQRQWVWGVLQEARLRSGWSERANRGGFEGHREVWPMFLVLGSGRGPSRITEAEGEEDVEATPEGTGGTLGGDLRLRMGGRGPWGERLRGGGRAGSYGDCLEEEGLEWQVLDSTRAVGGGRRRPPTTSSPASGGTHLVGEERGEEESTWDFRTRPVAYATGARRTTLGDGGFWSARTPRCGEEPVYGGALEVARSDHAAAEGEEGDLWGWGEVGQGRSQGDGRSHCSELVERRRLPGGTPYGGASEEGRNVPWWWGLGCFGTATSMAAALEEEGVRASRRRPLRWGPGVALGWSVVAGAVGGVQRWGALRRRPEEEDPGGFGCSGRKDGQFGAWGGPVLWRSTRTDWGVAGRPHVWRQGSSYGEGLWEHVAEVEGMVRPPRMAVALLEPQGG